MPSVSNQAPDPGSNIVPTTKIEFDVTFSGAFTIYARFADGQVDVVWNGTAFEPNYYGGSTTDYDGATSPCSFSVIRLGGWRKAPLIDVGGPVSQGAEGSGFTPIVNTFDPLIIVDEVNEVQVIPVSSGGVVLELSQAGHVDGARLRIICPAGHATGIVEPGDLRRQGDVFAASSDWILDIECVSEGLTNPAFRSVSESLPARDRTVPTVASAAINSSDTDKLAVTFTEAMKATNVTGWTLTGTSRTVTGIDSGQGTSTVVLQLSGAVSPTDVITVFYSGANTFRDLSGNALANGSHAVTNNSGILTGMIGRYRAADAVLASTSVTSIPDASGQGNDLIFASTRQPVITSANAAINNKASCKFDGVNDCGQCAALLVGGSNPADYTEYGLVLVAKLNTQASAVLFEATDLAGTIFSGLIFLTDAPSTLYWAAGSGSNMASQASPTTNAFKTYVTSLTTSNGAIEIRIDGASINTNGSAHNPAALRKFSLGASVGLLAGYYSPMDFAELIILDHKPTAGDLTTIANYVNSEYGL